MNLDSNVLRTRSSLHTSSSNVAPRQSISPVCVLYSNSVSGDLPAAARVRKLTRTSQSRPWTSSIIQSNTPPTTNPHITTATAVAGYCCTPITSQLCCLLSRPPACDITRRSVAHQLPPRCETPKWLLPALRSIRPNTPSPNRRYCSESVQSIQHDRTIQSPMLCDTLP